MQEKKLPEKSEIIIIGGGIVGLSCAYHLVLKGIRDLTLLEMGKLFKAGGSTYHAPGIVFQTNPSKTMTNFAKYTVDLLSNLTYNGNPCFYKVGGIEVAYTKERLEYLKYKLGLAKSYDIKGADIINPEEVKEKIPLIDSSKIYAGFYVPSDGVAKAVWALEVMGRKIEEKGGKLFGNTEVLDIKISNGEVKEVITSRGAIKCEKVILCTNVWAPLLGSKIGLKIPLVPMQHPFVWVGPIEELKGEERETVYPVLRHQDKSIYFRHFKDSYGIGSYYHEPLPLNPSDLPSYNQRDIPTALEFTPQHFEKGYNAAIELMPPLKKGNIYHKINGVFSFTPDGFPLLGEFKDIKGLWTALAVWITHAGGVGKAIAELLVDGFSEWDLRECDINRFHPYLLTDNFINLRSEEQYRKIYAIIHPMEQPGEPRNLRLSPFHIRLKELGAEFFEVGGWERPQWFKYNEKLLAGNYHKREGWEAKYWSPVQGIEHKMTREGVAIYDFTPLTKILVKGEDALEFLQYLTTNNLDKPIGKITYTLMLNKKGGIVGDLTVTRLAKDSFLLLLSSSMGLQHLSWINKNLWKGVQIIDLTSFYCCIGLYGPRARDLIERLSRENFSNFPKHTAKTVDLKVTKALTLNISYVGETGWEFYVPTEFGLSLWDNLWREGKDLGLIPAGLGALDSLRLEKGNRLWGNDINTEYNPFEAGLEFAVKLNKEKFIGKEALENIKDKGVNKKLCCITLNDKVVLGKEPVIRDSKVIGYITSANYGYTVRKCVMYAYLPIDYSKEGEEVEVYYLGNLYKAKVSKDPLLQ